MLNFIQLLVFSPECGSLTGRRSIYISRLCKDCHCSFAKLCPTLFNPMDCSKPDFPVHHCLPEFVQTLSHWVSDSIQPSCPLSSLSPPAFNLSQHQSLFQWVSALHQVAKYWNFSSHISPSNKYSGWISFRIDWFDLLAVQGTLKSLLQYHSLKASVLQHSTFFIRIKLLQPFQSLTSCSLNSLGIRERESILSFIWFLKLTHCASQQMTIGCLGFCSSLNTTVYAYLHFLLHKCQYHVILMAIA